MDVRVALASVVGALVAVLSVGALAAPVALATECANEAIRAQQGAQRLPDCRAYEMVSPNGATAYISKGAANYTAASVGGERLAWFSYYPPPGAQTDGMTFLSTRAADGWSTEGVTPAQSTSGAPNLTCSPWMFFGPELTAGVLADGYWSDGLANKEAEHGYCGGPASTLVAGEPEGVQNLFLRQLPEGRYELVNATPAGAVPADAHLQDVSTAAGEELSHVVFSEEAKLTPEAPAGEDLYEWVEGAVHLASVLPDGEPTDGQLVDATGHTGNGSVVGGRATGAAPITHAVSSDGSRLLFEAGGNLYLRVNAEEAQSKIAEVGGVPSTAVNGEQCAEPEKACTIQVDASSVAGEPGGGGAFLVANAQDTKVFFTDAPPNARLTATTLEGSGANLYLYELSSGQRTGTLTDVTAQAPEADVLGFSGAGEEGAELYFEAEGALTGANPAGQTPAGGSPNLYAYEADTETLSFIATLSRADRGDWADEANGRQQATVSSDGRYLLFDAIESFPTISFPSGYENEAEPELYLYDAASRGLECVSCNPGGEPPRGPTTIQPWEASANADAPGRLRRYVTDQGRVFFDSPNALVRADSSGQEELYEFFDGEVHLLSSGNATEGSYFYDASEDGEDVFFITTQQLLRRDTDETLSIYDARVGGGFPEPVTAAPRCAGEECQGPPEPGAILGPPASVAFTGPGNVARVLATHAAQSIVNHKRAGSKKAGKRRRKLRHALKRCSRIHRHNRHRRRACKRRARRRYGAKAARAQHHRRGHKRRQRRRARHHGHRHGGRK